LIFFILIGTQATRVISLTGVIGTDSFSSSGLGVVYPKPKSGGVMILFGVLMSSVHMELALTSFISFREVLSDNNYCWAFLDKVFGKLFGSSEAIAMLLLRTIFVGSIIFLEALSFLVADETESTLTSLKLGLMFFSVGFFLIRPGVLIADV
jgi:hypothetical protein